MSKTYSAGIVTAYGAAKRAGYQGTYEDFCRQQAGYAGNAAAIEQAKTAAQTAANTATTKAGEATTAATAAQTAKTQTEAAASQALTDIGTARSGAISAVQTEGQTQTANARAQAQAAATSATTASTKASEASASATSAGLSATNAAASATSAAQSASDAQDVLDSIPADYSDLSEDVDQLKADLADEESALKTGYHGEHYDSVAGQGYALAKLFDFTEASNNLFSGELSNGYYSNSVWVASDSVRTTDYIYLDGATSLVVCTWNANYSAIANTYIANYIYWFDEDKQFLSSTVNTGGVDGSKTTYAVPSGAVYARVYLASYTEYSLARIQICLDALPSTYVVYRASAYSFPDDINNGARALTEIDDFTVSSSNLFNKDTVETGYYIGLSGTQYSSANSQTTDFIPVKGGAQYAWPYKSQDLGALYNLIIHTYDSTKTRIEGIDTYNNNKYVSYTFGATVAYIRISSVNENFAPNFMFMEGECASAFYSPYGLFANPAKNITDAYRRNNRVCAWFGDSISQLRTLPHTVANITNLNIADCSFAGTPMVASSDANYQALGFKELVDAIVASDFSAQQTAIEAIGTATGASQAGKTENLINLSGLDFSTVTDVFVLYGTNDFGNAVAISDFKTGMGSAITALLTAYPSIMLYFISPPYRNDIATNGNGNTLIDFVNAEKEVCESFNIPFYDLYHNCHINSLSVGQWLQSDKLHPNKAGDLMLAKKCATFVMQ